MVIRVVVLRHGESQGNKERRFTGWTDVDLTEIGVSQAQEAGRTLKEAGFTFDIAYTSLLRRAVKTAWPALNEMGFYCVPIVKTWRLNERHLGTLEGTNMSDYTEESLGPVMKLNDTPLPKLEEDDVRHPRNDPRYRHLREDELPNGESLNDTLRRILPCWEQTIIPTVRSGQRVLIVTHGEIIRTLTMHLNHTDDVDNPIIQPVPTATAVIYELDNQMNLVRQEYLGRPIVHLKTATENPSWISGNTWIRKRDPVSGTLFPADSEKPE